MKQSLIKYSLLSGLIILSACADYPTPEYPNVGAPERLIDLSSETVSFGLNSSNSVAKLAAMVEEDRPTSAEFKCSLKNASCAQAKEIFERHSIPVHFTGANLNKVEVFYQRVIARDCDQRYIDDMAGSRSYNYSGFGCSVSANMLQMVSDKHQFTNPNILDLPDAEKANQSYSGYMKDSSKRDVKDVKWNTSSGGN